MRRKKKKPSRPTIEPQRWAGESALLRVHRFNEHGLVALAETAIEDEHLAALWRQMDPRAFKRAARCPVLLMELHFQRLDKWRRVAQRLKSPGVPQSSSPANERTTTLVREILLEAWTLGRTMPRALNLLFGMTSDVTATILKLSASDVDQIAAEDARHLTLRWPESRTFWKSLLEAAIGTNDRALKLVHLHCLQLLGSEVV